MITGGSGFIGSNLVSAIEQLNQFELVVCDTFLEEGQWQNIAKNQIDHILFPDQLFQFLEEYSHDIEAIVHMGAISSTTERNVPKIIQNNFQFSQKLWHWCVKNETRFIYASSAATYGSGENGFDDIYQPAFLEKLKPLNPYGWSKHLFDRYVAKVVYNNGPVPPQWAGLKFFNVYGPNEYHKGSMKSVVARFHPLVKSNQVVKLFKSHHQDYADGEQLRDFVWVGDCVDVMLWLINKTDINGIFNVGSGQARSFLDVIHQIYTSLELEPNIEFIDMPEQIRDQYQYYTQASLHNLRQAGFSKDMTSIETGVTRYVQNHLELQDPFV